MCPKCNKLVLSINKCRFDVLGGDFITFSNQLRLTHRITQDRWLHAMSDVCLSRNVVFWNYFQFNTIFFRQLSTSPLSFFILFLQLVLTSLIIALGELVAFFPFWDWFCELSESLFILFTFWCKTLEGFATFYPIWVWFPCVCSSVL